MTQSIEFMVPRYMTRFECIADRCEDTCCKGWVVNVDKPTYERIEEAMAEKGREDFFHTNVALVKGENATEVNYAHLQHQKDTGGCAFLDGGLCSIQNEYGHDMLPMTCKNFPRRLLKAHDEFELSGDLGCPEVARLVLLAEDAMELTGMPLEEAGFAVVKQEFSKKDPRPYHRHVNDIRTLAIHLLNDKNHSLKERLFFLIYFFNRISSFFHENATGDVSKALNDEMVFIRHPEAKEQLAQRVNEMEITGEVTFNLFNEIISLGASSKNSAFKQLIEEVFEAEFQAISADGALRVLTENRWRSHQANKDRVMAKAGERVNQYFSHMALNFWLQQWHIRSPNLIIHSQRLLTELAIARLLLFNHPHVLASLDRDDENFLAVLDATAVRVVYATDRFIAHSGLLQRAAQRLEEANLHSFAGAVSLLQY